MKHHTEVFRHRIEILVVFVWANRDQYCRSTLKAILIGVTVDLNIQGKFSISHIQLLVSRRLMWCDEANTVIQKTLGDGMDF